MDAAAWLGIAALAVAIMAIPVTVLATRQWGSRRARLEVVVDATPLLPGQARPGLLEVTYRDITVSEPHLVSVTFRNLGPRDLASEMFDSGRPITVKFDQVFYGLTAVHGGIKTSSPAIGASSDDAVVYVEPGLLKRGESWAFSAVTTGPVQVTIDAPLVDTDVRHSVPVTEDRAEVTLRLSVMGITAEVPLRWRF
ncbi:hypothetical protein J2W56_005981 [Nocardia kruczakiae]|uniref:DUF4352 domain-containing protein n=1 Tax=Nocardia kruczakiae TaxID=261477 RepID=A0ABU1XNS9_9NOCA|nr:hypothetical protein [Nocardia kruczakiae]MDR7172220.1 hypothetical protein [Nocardia kruczakiae]